VTFDLKNKTWQYFILTILAATWGSSFQLMKLGLRAFDPIEVALLRVTISFIALSPFVFYHIRTIPKDKWKWLLAAGFLGNGIPAFMFALGLSKIHGAMGGILNATAPLFTLIVGSIFFGSRFGKNAIWGVLIGLVGTGYLVLLAGKSNQQMDVVYAFFPLIGSLCYGFSSNIIKLKLKDIKPIIVTGAALMMQVPLTLVFVIYLGLPAKALSSSLHTESFLYITLLAIMGTSLAVLVFNYLIKHTTVLFAASVTYLVPVFAMGIGFIAGEAISIHYFIGMSIIIMGVWLTNKS
jgi:drug/metabolite transporter (DMT)-like permease